MTSILRTITTCCLLIGILLLLSMTGQAQTGSCEVDVPSLTIGEMGQVTPGTPNTVRDAPSLDGERIGQLAGDADFFVLDGPECADGYVWWNVQRGELVGWTAEGDGTVDWVVPIQPRITIATHSLLQAETVTRFDTGSTLQLGISDDGTLLAIAHSFEIVVWDVATQAEMSSFNTLFEVSNPIEQLIFSADNRYLAVRYGGRVSNYAVVYDLESNDIVVSFNEPETINDMAFMPDSSAIILASTTLDVVSLTDDTREALFALPEFSYAQVIDFHPDGTRLLVAVNEFASAVGGRLYEWDVNAATSLGYVELMGTYDTTHVTYHYAVDTARYQNDDIMVIDDQRGLRTIRTDGTLISVGTLPRYDNVLIPPDDDSWLLIIRDDEGYIFDRTSATTAAFATMNAAVLTTDSLHLYTATQDTVTRWSLP